MHRTQLLGLNFVGALIFKVYKDIYVCIKETQDVADEVIDFAVIVYSSVQSVHKRIEAWMHIWSEIIWWYISHIILYTLIVAIFKTHTGQNKLKREK